MLKPAICDAQCGYLAGRERRDLVGTQGFELAAGEICDQTCGQCGDLGRRQGADRIRAQALDMAQLAIAAMAAVERRLRYRRRRALRAARSRAPSPEAMKALGIARRSQGLGADRPSGWRSNRAEGGDLVEDRAATLPGLRPAMALLVMAAISAVENVATPSGLMAASWSELSALTCCGVNASTCSGLRAWICPVVRLARALEVSEADLRGRKRLDLRGVERGELCRPRRSPGPSSSSVLFGRQGDRFRPRMALVLIAAMSSGDSMAISSGPSAASCAEVSAAVCVGESASTWSVLNTPIWLLVNAATAPAFRAAI